MQYEVLYYDGKLIYGKINYSLHMFYDVQQTCPGKSINTKATAYKKSLSFDSINRQMLGQCHEDELRGTVTSTES